MAYRLVFWAFTAMTPGSIPPGLGTETPHSSRPEKNLITSPLICIVLGDKFAIISISYSLCILFSPSGCYMISLSLFLSSLTVK